MVKKFISRSTKCVEELYLALSMRIYKYLFSKSAGKFFVKASDEDHRTDKSTCYFIQSSEQYLEIASFEEKR